jgi:eukaryotic-like serine/threonine-protein kinase
VVADWESAFALAQKVEERLPGSRVLAELWPRLSWRVTIRSEPEGAMVYRQAYDAAHERWDELGRTPLVDIRVPYGLSRIRLELPGYRPSLRALGGAHLNWSELAPYNPDHLLVGPEIYRLYRHDSLPEDMAAVPGWLFTNDGHTLPVREFLMMRHEVTNDQFQAFVDGGGYLRPELWDPIVVAGDTIRWKDAMRLFVDRTGRAGPATWEGGSYPRGEAELPVSGVSWYEASAYARFVGRELPTAHHWQQALANSMFPWLLPASNFSGERPRAVTAGRAMSHVEVFDLTGNVREWTATQLGRERVILGGGWNDPYYIAATADASALPEDRSPANGIRLIITDDEPRIAARLRAPLTARSTTSVLHGEPVSDAVYTAYSRVFDYDRKPLDARVENTDSARVWIRERITFAAPYGAGRMELHLYTPTNAAPPYQTVVYWPGWDTFWLDDPDEYFAKQLDFVVRSGRAVAFPIYQGTFGRRVGEARRRAEFGTAEYRDNAIETVKDLRRTIDYLWTRSDIDTGSVALFGYSWGGINGPVAMAQEPRIRVGVIYIGLLPPMQNTPEVDPLHALPRVRVPLLMLSGEFDPMVPRADAARYFALVGTPGDRKRHIVAIGGHFIPRPVVVRETLDWLDRYLGRP